MRRSVTMVLVTEVAFSAAACIVEEPDLVLATIAGAIGIPAAAINQTEDTTSYVRSTSGGRDPRQPGLINSVNDTAITSTAT